MKSNSVLATELKMEKEAMLMDMSLVIWPERKPLNILDLDESDQYAEKALCLAAGGKTELNFDQESFDFQVRPLNFDDGRRF